MLLRAAALLLVLLAARSAHADALSDFDWMLGRWQVEFKVLASGDRPASTVRGSAVVSRELGDTWIGTRYTDPGFASQDYTTWDAEGHVWRTVGVDSGGTSWSLTARGWDGGKLVWTGEGRIAGSAVPIRLTWERRGPDVLFQKGELQQDGRWTVVDEITLRRERE